MTINSWSSSLRLGLTVFLILILLTMCFCESKVGLASRITTGKTLITEQQAVQIAEAYVDENGYADPYPRFHRWESIRNTFFTGGNSLANDCIVSNFLEPRAVGFIRPSYERDFWQIAFKGKKWEFGNQDEVGYAIRINPYGREIAEISSVGIIFSKLDKRLR